MTNAINTSNANNDSNVANSGESSSSNFFDLHLRGIGYLNRAREVKMRKGPSYLACDIAALRGDSSAPEKTKFDCTVVGEEAEKLIRRAMDASNDENRKVLLGFKLGDLWLDQFIYKSGTKIGQSGAAIKARLLLIEWMKVDGEMVYQRTNSTESSDGVQKTDDVMSTESAADSALDSQIPVELSEQQQSIPDVQSEAAENLPPIVELSKDDPDFDAKKTELKGLGYRFDNIKKVWRHPTMTASSLAPLI